VMGSKLNTLRGIPEKASVDRRIRVAFMLTPVEFGGAERVCMTLLKSINRERFDIFPILLTRPWEKDNMFVRELRKEGFEICEIPVALRETGDYLRVPRCYKLVWRTLKDGGFDLLHTHGYFADIVGIPVARLNELPSLSTCHGYIPTTWKVQLYNVLDRIALKFGTQVLAVSEAIKQGLVDSGLSPDKVQVVVNAVGSATDGDMTQANREALRKSHGIESTDFVLGYVGRLSTEKGLKYLLAACGGLVASGVPLRALIVGEGPQRNELRQLSSELGLGDRVVFAGFQEDVAQWLPCMDVFVLPSLTEGTPMALLEAMAHGVPAIASAVGGIPQVIKHGETGILVSPGSTEEIRKATLAMVGDPAARQKLAENALALVRRRYGIQQWIGRIEMEYQKLSRRSP
jgi:glycosyltransferase involved in cell wall biosynthesis